MQIREFVLPGVIRQVYSNPWTSPEVRHTERSMQCCLARGVQLQKEVADTHSTSSLVGLHQPLKERTAWLWLFPLYIPSDSVCRAALEREEGAEIFIEIPYTTVSVSLEQLVPIFVLRTLFSL